MTDELQALKVISAYVLDHHGYLPTNPNKLVSYSCNRYDLKTLDYSQAKYIIAIYQKNVDRMKKAKSRSIQRAKSLPQKQIDINKSSILHSTKNVKQRHKSKPKLQIKRTKLKPKSKSKSLSPRKITSTNIIRYKDIDTGNKSDNSNSIGYYDNDNDDNDTIYTTYTDLISSVLKTYISEYGYPPNEPGELIKHSNHKLTFTDAKNIINTYNRSQMKITNKKQFKSISQIEEEIESQETTSIPLTSEEITVTDNNDESRTNIVKNNWKNNRNNKKIVCVMWIIMICITLFGSIFGLIFIINGIKELKNNGDITQELCVIRNYTMIECEYSEYEYEYEAESFNKCGDELLYYSTYCGDYNDILISNLTILNNITCYVNDCDQQEFMLTNHDIIKAKNRIEIGSIVLIVTIIPCMLWVCWAWFCYQRGSK